MMVIDSNVWVALYDKADSQHVKAIDLSTSFVEVVFPEYVILETCTVLLTKAGKDVAEQFLAYILDSAEVTILYSSPEFFHATAQLFRLPTSKKLSFVDVSLLMLSEFHEVITFDKNLARVIEAQRKR